MSYNDTINYLYNLQKYGIKFGLDNIRRLMSALDNPHKSFLSVHVAGTNGKGSTSAIIASILKTAGYKVGLFTSPHIVSFTERIRVNGKEITEIEVIELAEEIKDIVGSKDFSPTFFEVVTAMALLYFKRKKIDIAVIEVGMGGRLDATNIITPEVSVITNISYDHGEFLGNTLKEIAYEKACIIKKGISVVSSMQNVEAEDVIKTVAIEKGSPLFIYGKNFKGVLKSSDLKGITFDYCDSDSFTIHDLFLPLIGEHQMQNASVAIKAVELFYKRRLKPAATHHSSLVTSHFIREGLENVRWPGRLEFIKEDPYILIDGAHNPAAAESLSKALKKIFLEKFKRIIIVLGIMGDKDVKGIMEPLLPLVSEIILTSPSYERAASPEKLAGIAASLGFFNVRTAYTVKDAIGMATERLAFSVQHSSKDSELRTTNSELILITGSFYTIGEAKEAIGHKGVLARLRE